MILEVVIAGAVCFFLGLIAGAKIQKNIVSLERWARNNLAIIGVET